MVANAHWRRLAACGGIDPNIFFPPYYNAAHAKKALRICSECPVRLECLKDAVTEYQEFGIFGGTTPNERKRLVYGNGRPPRATKRPPPVPGTAGHSMQHRKLGEPQCEDCMEYNSVKNKEYKARKKRERKEQELGA
jgi:WhiB family redox-sensing transcriptional regulator